MRSFFNFSVSGSFKRSAGFAAGAGKTKRLSFSSAVTTGSGRVAKKTTARTSISVTSAAAHSHPAYLQLVQKLQEKVQDEPDKPPRRQLARQAARGVLPNATATNRRSGSPWS